MKTIIFDGSNLLHRCFWVNSVRPTISVEYLFLNSIRKCVSRYNVDDIVCMWDERNTRDTKNYRQVLTEETYKSTRDREKAKKVYAHVPSLQELTQLLGVINLHPDMLEADDYMHWLSKYLKDTVIVTSDSDLIQCVSPTCTIYNPIKDIEIDSHNFTTITDTSTSEEYIQYKAMVGDKSDNIPGLDGIGHKRALEIIHNNKINTLSTDQKKILEKNIELIDLDAGVGYHENEISWYKMLYARRAAKKKVNTQRFKKRCVELKLNNVLKNYSDWIRVFDKSKTIENVVEKLIRLNL